MSNTTLVCLSLAAVCFAFALRFFYTGLCTHFRRRADEAAEREMDALSDDDLETAIRRHGF